MCGIFLYVGESFEQDEFRKSFDKIKMRGPDNSSLFQISEQVLLGFHRLNINDLSTNGMQPLYHPSEKSLLVICNGEIYNHEELKEEYNFETSSNSDCEIIIHLYKNLRDLYDEELGTVKAANKAIYELCNMLDGVFAFSLYDKKNDLVFFARDRFGVRPAFYGYTNVNEFMFASEAKAMIPFSQKINQFPPGCYGSIDPRYTLNKVSFNKYYEETFEYRSEEEYNEEETLDKVRELFTKAVDKRLMSERPVCSLLSGGLDSSLVSALAARKYKPYTFETYAVGITGSPDLVYARKVADHIKSKHTNIELSKEDFLDAIEETIYITETFDTTTVRASVGNYLVSKYIRENSECKVVYNGDYSDEVAGGYLYFRNAPSKDEFHKECLRLLQEIHYFDCLRSDRTVSSQGLESRVPFADKDFIEYYLKIPPKYRMYDEDRMEKYLIRKAFDGEGLLPDVILWRPKEAFSDGVS